MGEFIDIIDIKNAIINAYNKGISLSSSYFNELIDLSYIMSSKVMQALELHQVCNKDGMFLVSYEELYELDYEQIFEEIFNH